MPTQQNDASPQPDAVSLLRELTGRQLSTLSGRANRILEIRGDDVIVATSRSPAGQPVPIAWVQEALDRLREERVISIDVDSVGYRSAFIGAVLRELPDARVEGLRIRLPVTRGSLGETLQLQRGRIYDWEQLGARFGFKAAFFSVAGGMLVSKAVDAVLLITHPGGGKSFDYEDYWDGADLIYTGRGKVGNQARMGPNLDVSENRRSLFAFEAAGPKLLRYLGQPLCVEERTGRARDGNGDLRTVLQFRLRFESGEGREFAATPSDTPPARRDRHVQRRPRPFVPNAPVPSAIPSGGLEPEELQARQEKANAGHAKILENLDRLLRAAGWHDVEQIPAAVDLWATHDASGDRVIFEAKTIGPKNELRQCRGGLAQLLEYRVEYGAPDDALCLAVDEPISLRRGRMLDAFDIGVLLIHDSGCEAVNDAGSRLARLIGRRGRAALTAA